MKSTLGVAVTALTAALLAAPASAHDVGHRDRPLSRADKRELTAVKRATAKYRDVSAAVRDGYVPTDHCVSEPGIGAMGFHYVNPTLAVGQAIRPRQPEILLYLPTTGGGRKLGGVEYYRIDPDQDVSTVAGRPWRFHQPFDGPMLGHEPGTPVHFDLHVWLCKRNPRGTFAQYNPAAHCAAR